MIQAESITIVLPVHNRREFTLRCIRVLAKQSIKGFRVIVVDSGSSDGTADEVERQFPEVIVLRCENLLWSGATNQGVTRALAENSKYILTLNDDVELSSDYMEVMIRTAERHPSTVMGSYALDIHTGEGLYCGDRPEWILGRTVQLLEKIPPNKRRGLLPVPFLPARGLWVPAEVFRTVGLFDASRLPHYCGDQDLTARAARKGFNVMVNCDAVLYCHAELSGGDQIRHSYSWANYRAHLFGRLGGGNLKYFTIFAFRHCPRQYLLVYWPLGCLRRVGGYLLDWARAALFHPRERSDIGR